MKTKTRVDGGVLAVLGLLVAKGDPVRPGEETDPGADVRAAAEAARKPEAYETPAHLRFPYVSTYYVKPVVMSGETVKVGFFTTDWDSSKIRFLDDRFRFDVFLEYAAEGGSWKTLSAKNVKSGDGEIVLGKLPVGDYTLRLWSVDRGNRLESHRVIHEFKVVPENYFDDSSATSVMAADDLAAYGIDNRGETGGPVPVTDPKWPALEAAAEKNLAGLQKLIRDKAAAGVRKLVLLKGTYRLSAKGKLEMVDNFTLDLNGATLKQNAFTGDKGALVIFPSVHNAHLVNGTLEGDYYDHDYENSPNKSEWPMGFSISGDSRYSSVRQVVVKDITGYGGSNGIGNDARGGVTWWFPQPLDRKNWQAGSLDAKGDVQPDPARFSSGFQPFRKVAGDTKYLQISKYLGYQGRATRSWWMTVCWYDGEKRFMSSETAFQYRPMLVPKRAEYLRVSVETASREDAENCALTMCHFRVPWNCAVVRCTFDNCRAVGYAGNQMKNHLFQANEFTRSGQTLARCAFDAEDGWDQMQDVFFFENRFHDNPHNNSILTCSGQNFVMERNRGDIHLWGRTYSPCVRDNDIGQATFHCDSRLRSGYGRFENNRYEKGLTMGMKGSDGWDYVLSGLEFGSKEKPFALKVGESGRLVGCTIRGDGVQVGNLYDCRIEDCTLYYIPDGSWDKVTVRNSTLNYVYGTNSFNRCTFENFKLHGLSRGRKTFTDCVFRGLQVQGLASADAEFRNCNMSAATIRGGYCETPARLAFVGSAIEVADANAFLSLPVYTVDSVLFDTCWIGGGPKPLVEISDLRSQPTDDRPADIAVRRCTFSPAFKSPVVVSVPGSRSKDLSRKAVTVTGVGNSMPKGVSLISEKDIPPTWKVGK